MLEGLKAIGLKQRTSLQILSLMSYAVITTKDCSIGRFEPPLSPQLRAVPESFTLLWPYEKFDTVSLRPLFWMTVWPWDGPALL